MSALGVDFDELLTCPYFVNHRVARRRFIAHLTKCAKDPRAPPLESCPFDMTHRIDKSLFENHLVTCPSATSAIRDMVCARERAETNRNDASWPNQGQSKIEDDEVSDPWSEEATQARSKYTIAGLKTEKGEVSGALRADGSINHTALQRMKPAERRKLYDEMIKRQQNRNETKPDVRALNATNQPAASSSNNPSPQQPALRPAAPGIGRGRVVRKTE
ncbi:uncharacterized protein LOC141858708 [Brevipalpus obovatus]|uniref:uncharacterized protein LOC141858708 n=1 Tax=Brevipalpus obovatus TaxID=246614 RepID=UPI003D9F9AE2